MLRSVERSRANSRAEAKCFGAEFFCKLQLWSRIRLCPLPVRIHIIIVMSALIIIGYRSEWVCRAVLDPSKPEESLLWHPETAVAAADERRERGKKLKPNKKAKKPVSICASNHLLSVPLLVHIWALIVPCHSSSFECVSATCSKCTEKKSNTS